MNKRMWLVLMQVIPKKIVSRMFGRMARQRWTRYFIPLYIKWYGIETNDLVKDPSAYDNLTDFFVRQLQTTARPIDPATGSVTSPVDGTVSQLGKMETGSLIQAKGNRYTVEQLLAGDTEKAAHFFNGHFLTLYLSPKDYHRIHAPFSGSIEGMVYCPGHLFPVNTYGVQYVKQLFVKNERILTYMETSFGPLAIVKVGAMNVGSVKVNYDEQVRTNTFRGKAYKRTYEPPIPVRKGEELGRFEFGSTVILLFPQGVVSFLEYIRPGTSVRMGESIGRVRRHS